MSNKHLEQLRNIQKSKNCYVNTYNRLSETSKEIPGCTNVKANLVALKTLINDINMQIRELMITIKYDEGTKQ